MARRGTVGVCAGLACLAAAVVVHAGPRAFFQPGTAPRSAAVMLYFSHSIGAGASAQPMRPTFGLRVQQVRQGVNTGDPESGDAMQHRDLLNWQMEAHSNLHLSDLRVKLGNRLTYDITNRRFGSPATRSTMQIGLPSLRNGPANPAQPRPVFARASAGAVNSARDSGRDNSNLREIAAAAIAALSPARLTSAQRQAAQRQGGLAGVVAAQRMQAATAMR